MGKRINLLIAATAIACGVCGAASGEAPEIPKSGMTAVASREFGGTAYGAIDGSTAGGGWLAKPLPAWLRLDMGGRYNVEKLGYQPRIGDSRGRTKMYYIYVTDDPDVWGTRVAWGFFLSNNDRQDVTFPPKAGRYVIFNCTRSYGVGTGGAAEVYLYGEPAADVMEFEVADRTSGSTLIINSPTVDVMAFTADPAGGEITHYQITQTKVAPAVDDTGWQEFVPQTYTIAGVPLAAAGVQMDLVGWVKTAAGEVGGSIPQRIFYTSLTLAEVPKDEMQVSASAEDEGSAENTINGNAGDLWSALEPPQWLTIDLGDNYLVGYFEYLARQNVLSGRMQEYNVYVTDDPGTRGEPVASGEWSNSLYRQGTPLTTTRGRYVILEGLSSYSYTGSIGAAEVWVYATSGSIRWWPVDGDANLDCEVNILDMIFIRNRLNQDPETDDNWRADVNQDGKINILDMIFVRNVLNNRCEQ